MARLTAGEQAYFYKLFVKNTVDVWGFFRTELFDDFCEPIVGFRLSDEYGKRYSPGECLQDFLRNEDVSIVVPLMRELLEHNIVSDRMFSVFKEDLIDKCQEIIVKYSSVLGLQQMEVKFNSDYIDAFEKEMFKNIIENPTEAIGQAKELIETCCKTILEEEKIKINKKWDINDLVNETLSLLELMPKQVDLEEKGSENIKALLGNLKSIPNYLAELRNYYGSGHGKSKNFESLEERHAKLAVGASLTFVGFVWDTFKVIK